VEEYRRGSGDRLEIGENQSSSKTRSTDQCLSAPNLRWGLKRKSATGSWALGDNSGREIGR
jgi:hypothetical protein